MQTKIRKHFVLQISETIFHLVKAGSELQAGILAQISWTYIFQKPQYLPYIEKQKSIFLNMANFKRLLCSFLPELRLNCSIFPIWEKLEIK